MPAPAGSPRRERGTAGGGANNEIVSARQQQIRYRRLEERFSDFKNVDSLTLPEHYVIYFTQEQQSGRTTVSEGSIQESEVGNNTPLDPRNFDVK